MGLHYGRGKSSAGASRRPWTHPKHLLEDDEGFYDVLAVLEFLFSAVPLKESEEALFNLENPQWMNWGA